GNVRATIPLEILDDVPSGVEATFAQRTVLVAAGLSFELPGFQARGLDCFPEPGRPAMYEFRAQFDRNRQGAVVMGKNASSDAITSLRKYNLGSCLGKVPGGRQSGDTGS